MHWHDVVKYENSYWAHESFSEGEKWRRSSSRLTLTLIAHWLVFYESKWNHLNFSHSFELHVFSSLHFHHALLSLFELAGSRRKFYKNSLSTDIIGTTEKVSCFNYSFTQNNDMRMRRKSCCVYWNCPVEMKKCSYMEHVNIFHNSSQSPSRFSVECGKMCAQCTIKNFVSSLSSIQVEIFNCEKRRENSENCGHWTTEKQQNLIFHLKIQMEKFFRWVTWNIFILPDDGP